MRRKAQTIAIEPTTTIGGGDQIMMDLFETLSQQEGGPRMDGQGPHGLGQGPNGPGGMMNAIMPEEGLEMAPIEGPLGIETEAIEQAATNKTECAINCLEKALDMFEEYEQLEDGGKISNEEDAAENKAIEKIDKLLQEMKDALEELKEAEIEEHEEKMEEASGEEDDDEEIEEAEGEEAEASDGSEGSEGSEGSKPLKETSETEGSEGSEGSKEAGVRGFTKKAAAVKVVEKDEALIDRYFEL